MYKSELYTTNDNLSQKCYSINGTMNRVGLLFIKTNVPVFRIVHRMLIPLNVVWCSIESHNASLITLASYTTVMLI